MVKCVPSQPTNWCHSTQHWCSKSSVKRIQVSILTWIGGFELELDSNMGNIYIKWEGSKLIYLKQRLTNEWNEQNGILRSNQLNKMQHEHQSLIRTQGVLHGILCKTKMWDNHTLMHVDIGHQVINMVKGRMPKKNEEKDCKNLSTT